MERQDDNALPNVKIIEEHDDLSRARARLKSVFTAMRPELTAGGFPHDDGTVQFYTRVNALLFPNAVLLDYGAGRGRQSTFRMRGILRPCKCFKAKSKKLSASTCMPEIHELIRYLDEKYVIQPGERVPLPSGTIDIVVADWVLATFSTILNNSQRK